MDVKLPQGRWW